MRIYVAFIVSNGWEQHSAGHKFLSESDLKRLGEGCSKRVFPIPTRLLFCVRIKNERHGSSRVHARSTLDKLVKGRPCRPEPVRRTAALACFAGLLVCVSCKGWWVEYMVAVASDVRLEAP
jgi:hypothetical protein